jgi:hypothetical protein
VLLVPFALFTAFVMLSTINIGVRYYLPAYPFLFITGGALLQRLLRLRRRRALGTAAVALALAWTAFEYARAYPDYMSYMNQLASSRPHWWYLSDSNVEWSEDIGGLAAYLRAHGEKTVTAALLGGYPLLPIQGIGYVDPLAGAGPRETKYFAIGASYLNGSTVPGGPPGSGRETDELRVNYFDDYRRRTPEAVIGDSIYVFRVR